MGYDRQRESQSEVNRKTVIYQLTDRLHHERTVQVTADDIAATVSTWLSALGTNSPLVDDFAHAVRVADWPRMRALGDSLSLDVTGVA